MINRYRSPSPLDLLALVVVGISGHFYFVCLFKNYANITLECLVATSLVICYCVISLLCFIRFGVDKKYRLRILSSKFVSRGLTVWKILIASLLGVLLPHFLLPEILYQMDNEMASVAFIAFFILCISIEGFNVRFTSLLWIASGVIFVTIGFDFSAFSVSNPKAFLFLFIVIISVTIAAFIYRRSTLMEDTMVSAMLLLIPSTVVSIIIMFIRVPLRDIKHEVSTLAPYFVKQLLLLAALCMPILILSITCAISRGSMSYFGLSAVFQLAASAGSWIVCKALNSTWRYVLAVVSGCFMMIYGCVEAVDMGSRYEELREDEGASFLDASVLDPDDHEPPITT